MIPHAPGLFSGLHVAGDFPFSDAVRFTFGGPIHNLWPLLALPALAALASDRAARILPRAAAAGPAALALAAAPGLLAALLILNSWSGLQPFETWRGWMVFRATPAFTLAMVGLAAWRFWRRQMAVRRLFGVSRQAGARLAAAACGLAVRELPTQDAECFVAGALKPTVFVSAGALARLDNEALAAALAHERAHVRGGDPLTLTLLAMLHDLAPFGRRTAEARFLAAREARADQAAAGHAGALALASALLALAQPAPRLAAVLPMAAAETLAWRMDALLGLSPSPRKPVPLGAWAPLAFLAWPIAQRALLSMFCG